MSQEHPDNADLRALAYEVSRLSSQVSSLSLEVRQMHSTIDHWRGGLSVAKWIGGAGGIAGLIAFVKTFFPGGAGA